MRLITQSNRSSMFSLDFIIDISTLMWVRLNKDKSIVNIIVLKHIS